MDMESNIIDKMNENGNFRQTKIEELKIILYRRENANTNIVNKLFRTLQYGNTFI